MHKLREDIGDTLQELTQLQVRLEQERDEDRPISLQACKLSDSQLMQLDAYREHGGFTPERVANLRREALEAPRALSQSMLQTMSSIRVWKPDEVARPPWVSQVAAQRDHFRSTIFIVEHAGRALHLKFLFATQSPVYIGFGVMKEEHHHVVMQEVGSSNWDELSRDYWPLRFRFDFLEHVAWSEIADVPIESIGVLPFVSYHGCNLCVSCSEVVTLASFLESLPSLRARASASSTSQAQRGMPRDHASDLVIKYPWLAGSLERDVAAARTTASSSGGAGEVVEEMSCEALTDEQIEQAFTALRAEREKYAGDDDEEVVDWRVSVLGGAWTVRHRGVAFNAFRSAPRVSQSSGQPITTWARVLASICRCMDPVLPMIWPKATLIDVNTSSTSGCAVEMSATPIRSMTSMHMSSHASCLNCRTSCRAEPSQGFDGCSRWCFVVRRENTSVD